MSAMEQFNEFVKDVRLEAAKVSWPAVAGGRYRLESSSRLDVPDWKTVTTVTNDSTKAATLSGTESLGADGSARFYRVTFEP